MIEMYEEVNEQIYVTKGLFKIGLMYGQRQFYYVRQKDKFIVGAYESLLSLAAEFHYKTLEFVEGYGLRKQMMIPILEKFPYFKA